MLTINTVKKSGIMSAFEIRGEKFVVLKKDYLDELIILMKSFIDGEQLLKSGKTRSFSEFSKTSSKRKK